MWLTLYYEKILGDREIRTTLGLLDNIFIRMTVIFSDFDAFSPLINCIVAHRKLKSCDQNFLWAKMQFFNGEIPSKSENITVILIYCPKVPT